MARKILNRKELRKQAEAAEGASPKGAEPKSTPESTSEETQPTKLPKPTKRSKSRSKADKEVRLKAFWGVFNQNLRRVALFEYSERKLADKKADELTQSTKIPHFVQVVKEVIEE
ncbi:MAG TPA: hypothetical protein PK777_07860 [Thermoguttaceae bacterium]|nr:hypothetical protein [Thermoguttaceae bacterium]